MTRDDWSATLAGSGRLVVGVRQRRAAFFTCTSLLLAGGGVLAVRDPADTAELALGWFAIAFFVLCAVVLGWIAIGVGGLAHGVVVDGSGVAAETGRLRVGWDEIAGARVIRIRGTRVIELALADGRTRSLPPQLAVDAGAFAAWLVEEARRRQPAG